MPEAQRQRPALRIGSLPPWYHATQAGVGATIAASVHGTTYPGHAGDHLAAGRREHRIRQPVRSHEFPDAAAPLRYCALVKLAFIISQGHVATPTGVVTTVTEACGPASTEPDPGRYSLTCPPLAAVPSKAVVRQMTGPFRRDGPRTMSPSTVGSTARFSLPVTSTSAHARVAAAIAASTSASCSVGLN